MTRAGRAALALLVACGCATAGPGRPVAAALEGCPEEPVVDSARELTEANLLIKEAGEHVSDAALAEILPRLRRAALAGNLAAQRRLGYYVVGYYLTDLMFWPAERATAVTALAMLRVAIRRGAPGADPWDGLGRDPVVLRDEVIAEVPAEWAEAAVAEAAEWERCHPGVSPAQGDWSAAGWRPGPGSGD